MTQIDSAVADAGTAPSQKDAFSLTPPPTATAMSVTKRNGSREPVDLNKIVRAVQRNCEGLHAIDPMRVATRTISGLYDGASTRELDELSIRTAALLTGEEPEYSRLAARLLAAYIAKEVTGQEIHAFSQSVTRGHEVGLINDRLLNFVQTNARKLNDAIDFSLDLHFDYYRQFVLEAKFGFNKMSLKLFASDLLKNVVVGAVIGLPLAWVILALMEKSGDLWWLYAWFVWSGFQLLMLVLYPTVIAPLFNKFTPLQDESLTVKVTRSALAKLDGDPARLFN